MCPDSNISLSRLSYDLYRHPFGQTAVGCICPSIKKETAAMHPTDRKPGRILPASHIPADQADPPWPHKLRNLLTSATAARSPYMASCGAGPAAQLPPSAAVLTTTPAATYRSPSGQRSIAPSRGTQHRSSNSHPFVPAANSPYRASASAGPGAASPPSAAGASPTPAGPSRNARRRPSAMHTHRRPGSDRHRRLRRR